MDVTYSNANGAVVLVFNCEEQGCDWDFVLIEFDGVDEMFDAVEEHRRSHRASTVVTSGPIRGSFTVTDREMRWIRDE